MQRAVGSAALPCVRVLRASLDGLAGSAMCCDDLPTHPTTQPPIQTHARTRGQPTWAVCASPMDSRAPATWTGRNRVLPAATRLRAEQSGHKGDSHKLNWAAPWLEAGTGCCRVPGCPASTKPPSLHKPQLQSGAWAPRVLAALAHLLSMLPPTTPGGMELTVSL